MTEKNVASAVLDQLSAWGVRNIYGLVGDDILYLLDSLGKQESIKFFHVRHEESAALMASAQAKLTGEMGVCLADGGPGTVHMMNGLADAFMDNVPVMAITGQVALKEIGTNAKQYIDQQTLYRPLVSYTGMLCDPEAVPHVMENAFRPAVAGRSVAHISIPMDVFPMPCGSSPIPRGPYISTLPASGPDVVSGAVAMMRGARRPVILAGAGGRMAGPEISDLALRWGAAVINTLAGTGVVERAHPLYAGGLGLAGSPASSSLMSQADMCLVVGANWWPDKYVPQNIPVLQIDINPANIGSSTPVAYGLVGDARELVREISDRLDTTPGEEWLETIKKEISGWLDILDREATSRETPVHPAALIRAIQETVDDEAVICLDTGDHTVWFGRVFRPVRQRVLVSGKWRTMGFGLPAAIAARINMPARQVLALVGDGSLAMTMCEFPTAVRYGLAVTVVVANNHSLSLEKNKMAAGGLKPEGTFLYNPDFAGYARDCGGLGMRVENPGELHAALREALDSGRPALVDVNTADFAVPGTALPKS